MFSWLTGTFAGKLVATFFISMVPVIELRAGLPYGIALGLPYPAALAAAVLGNMLPVPFIILYIRKIFRWLRRIYPGFDKLLSHLEGSANNKGKLVSRVGPIGLIFFVGIPLPGTGAWTGALIAAMLDIRLKNALPAILLGLALSSAIMTAITFGVIHIL